MRVYELAKKLGVTSKDILAHLVRLGIKGKTHSSGIDQEILKKIETLLSNKTAAAKKEPEQPGRGW